MLLVYAIGKVAMVGLHSGDQLTSTSLLEHLVFGLSVGEAAARADRPSAAVADCACRAIKCWLVTTILAAGPVLLSLLLSRGGKVAVIVEVAAILMRLRSVMWEDIRVVCVHSGLKHAMLGQSAMHYKANRLWEEEAGGGRQRCCVTRRVLAWPWQVL
jgi:aspartate oxidase